MLFVMQPGAHLFVLAYLVCVGFCGCYALFFVVLYFKRSEAQLAKQEPKC